MIARNHIPHITCTTPDCTRPAQARGLCHTHYVAASRRGEFTQPAGPALCHCGRLATVDGVCRGHRRVRGYPVELGPALVYVKRVDAAFVEAQMDDIASAPDQAGV